MANAPMSSPEKDPEDWVTRDEPMTGPQHSYLQTLAREAGEDVPADLTKAQASELIDRLQQKTDAGARSLYATSARAPTEDRFGPSSNDGRR
jgi:hypothetical protein